MWLLRCKFNQDVVVEPLLVQAISVIDNCLLYKNFVLPNSSEGSNHKITCPLLTSCYVLCYHQSGFVLVVLYNVWDYMYIAGQLLSNLPLSCFLWLV